MKSRAELEQIFDRISKQFSFEDAHLELATDERMDGLIDFIVSVFLPDEPTSKAIGLEGDAEMDALLRHMYRENISVLVISDITDEIIAIRASHMTHRDDQKVPDINNKKFKAIFEFLVHKDEELNAFDKYGVDEAVQLVMLAVDDRFRKRGIASKLMEAAILFYSEIGLDPVVLKGEGTSNFSKAIYEKCGFETLHEIVYEDYKVDGDVVFKNTGIHKTMKIFAKKM